MSPRSAYMLEYYKKSPILNCDICGRNYKRCYGYKHTRTKHHVKVNEFLNKFETL